MSGVDRGLETLERVPDILCHLCITEPKPKDPGGQDTRQTAVGGTFNPYAGIPGLGPVPYGYPD